SQRAPNSNECSRCLRCEITHVRAAEPACAPVDARKAGSRPARPGRRPRQTARNVRKRFIGARQQTSLALPAPTPSGAGDVAHGPLWAPPDPWVTQDESIRIERDVADEVA